LKSGVINQHIFPSNRLFTANIAIISEYCIIFAATKEIRLQTLSYKRKKGR
jgi:hypothetical protein